MSGASFNSVPTAHRDAAVGAPILILIPSSGGTPQLGAETRLLGLSLRRRIELAARASGYQQVVELSRDDPGLPRTDWSSMAALADTGHAAPLILVSALAVGEIRWLDRAAAVAADARGWAAEPDRVIVISASVMRHVLPVLAEGGGARDFSAVLDRLTRHYGPPAALPPGVDPMLIETERDLRAAEHRLLRSAVKDTDGFMARHVERPISLAISRLLATTTVTPNQMTLCSLAVGLASAPFFLSARASVQTIGALLFLTHSIIDGCDGELARIKFQASRLGGIIDFWSDNIVHCVVFGCIAFGWSRALGRGWPLWLGAAAILGTIGSAGFIYWRMIRLKDGAGPVYTSVSATPGGRLTRILDALSRRDFIYVLLGFALFGKAGWFLLLTAVGAPTFLFLVLAVAWREGVAAPSTA